MIVSTLEHPEQHKLWPGIRALLESGASRGAGKAYDANTDLVWIVIDGRQILAALATSILTDGTAEICHAGGQRAAEWVPFADDVICRWARDCGAGSIRTEGRKGWGRLSAGLGWDVIGRDGKDVIYEKVLR